jgi:hypothetical protein
LQTIQFIRSKSGLLSSFIDTESSFARLRREPIRHFGLTGCRSFRAGGADDPLIVVSDVIVSSDQFWTFIEPKTHYPGLTGELPRLTARPPVNSQRKLLWRVQIILKPAPQIGSSYGANDSSTLLQDIAIKLL